MALNIPGLSGSVSVMIVWDDQDNVGLMISPGGAGTTPTGNHSGGFIVGWTSANTIFDLGRATTVYAGGSFGIGPAGGLDILSGKNKDDSKFFGFQLWGGYAARFPLPFEFHGGAQGSNLYGARRIPGWNAMIYNAYRPSESW